jgi:uncharacterized membrane protein YqgA involved in biofilm formation
MEELAQPGWAAALEATILALAVKQAPGVYPVINVLHVLAVGLIIGGIAALDLRLLGFAKDIPVKAAELFLRRIAAAGVVMAVPTGALLFLADASALSGNSTFLTKLVLVALALANAALFMGLWRGRIADWDVSPPLLGKLQAFLSLSLWFSAATAGRLIAFY